jgi:hypothetical protein
VSNRTCGECKLCCYLVPTPEIDLPANTHCKHECRKGCAIYDHRPTSCRMWSCLWLLGEDVGPRPDRSGYVVDMMPDYVTSVDHESGAEQRFPIYQIWIDPARPDAHRHPALRRWLAARHAENGMMGIVRYGNDGGMLLVPPARNETREWVEKTSNMRQGPANPVSEVLHELARQGISLEVELEHDNVTLKVSSGGDHAETGDHPGDHGGERQRAEGLGELRRPGAAPARQDDLPAPPQPDPPAVPGTVRSDDP